jgi:hypothetical protein
VWNALELGFDDGQGPDYCGVCPSGDVIESTLK